MLADNVGYGDIGAFAGGEVRGIPTPNIDQLASELVKINRGEPSLTATYPWVVAFTFSLLHGLGFAGALSQVGLPQNEIPLTVWSKNSFALRYQHLITDSRTTLPLYHTTMETYNWLIS